MSNPGVITLTEKRIGTKKNLRIEDNLGESIHIHYNDIRIDLTIRDLLQLSDICDDTIYDLVKAAGFNLDDYDCSFLLKYSKFFLDLAEVKRESVPLKDVRILTNTRLGIPVTKPLKRVKEKDMASENDFMPVVFNNNDILVYGVGKALKQYAEDHNGELQVLRLKFEKNKHSVSKTPWVKFFFHWDKRRIKETGYRLAKKLL